VSPLVSVRPALPSDLDALCRIASAGYRAGFAGILDEAALARVTSS